MNGRSLTNPAEPDETRAVLLNNNFTQEPVWSRILGFIIIIPWLGPVIIFLFVWPWSLSSAPIQLFFIAAGSYILRMGLGSLMRAEKCYLTSEHLVKRSVNLFLIKKSEVIALVDIRDTIISSRRGIRTGTAYSLEVKLTDGAVHSVVDPDYNEDRINAIRHRLAEAVDRAKSSGPVALPKAQIRS